MRISPQVIESGELPVFHKNPEEKIILFHPILPQVVEPGGEKYLIPYFVCFEHQVATWFGVTEITLMIYPKMEFRGIFVTVHDKGERVKYGGAIVQINSPA